MHFEYIQWHRKMWINTDSYDFIRISKDNIITEIYRYLMTCLYDIIILAVFFPRNFHIWRIPHRLCCKICKIEAQVALNCSALWMYTSWSWSPNCRVAWRLSFERCEDMWRYVTMREDAWSREVSEHANPKQFLFSRFVSSLSDPAWIFFEFEVHTVLQSC